MYDLKRDFFSYSQDIPQHLCKKCGKCCKAIITPYTYDELKKLAKNGQDEARVFLDVFKRYNSLDDAKSAVPEHVENILNELLKNNPNTDISKISFYYCPHLKSDNSCDIYATRPDCCRRAPRNGWSLFPAECGFQGWQFLQREKIKAFVRKMKEFILELELLAPDTFIESRNMTVEELIKFLTVEIESYKKYGSEKW